MSNKLKKYSTAKDITQEAGFLGEDDSEEG